MTRTFYKSSEDRVAITRTVMPAIWAGVVAWVFNSFGMDLNGLIAKVDGDGGLAADQVAQNAPLVLFAGLYLLGKFVPIWGRRLEKILLGVAVEGTHYETVEPTPKRTD